MSATTIATTILQLTSAVMQAAVTLNRAAELLETSRGRDLTAAEVDEIRNNAADARGRLDQAIADMEAGAPPAPGG